MGDTHLDDRRFGIPQRATASQPAPKHIYEPGRGQSCRSLAMGAASTATRMSSGECRMKGCKSVFTAGLQRMEVDLAAGRNQKGLLADRRGSGGAALMAAPALLQ